MHPWAWPQYVVAIWFILDAILDVYNASNKRTAGDAVSYMIGSVLVMLGIIYILHAGGFW